MLKKTTSFLLVFAVFIISPTLSAGQIVPITGPSMAITYEIGPKDSSATITNYWIWKIKGECKIFIKQESSSQQSIDNPTDVSVFAEVKSGTVSFQDIVLSSNQSQLVEVPLNQYVSMSATSGASLKLTNKSNYHLVASCRST